ELGDRQLEPLTGFADGVDVLAAPRPELNRREPELGGRLQPLDKRQAVPPHLEVDGHLGAGALLRGLVGGRGRGESGGGGGAQEGAAGRGHWQVSCGFLRPAVYRAAPAADRGRPLTVAPDPAIMPGSSPNPTGTTPMYDGAIFELQRIALYEAFRRNMRRSAVQSLIFAAINGYLAVMAMQNASCLGFVIPGFAMTLVIEGVGALLWPVPAILIANGLILMLCGVFNLLLAALVYAVTGNVLTVALIFGGLYVYWSVKVFRHYAVIA